MNMNNETPSPGVQALIAARYVTRPGFATPDQYNTVKQEAKQITRAINAELTRPEPDFQKAVESSQVLVDLLSTLRVMHADLCRQTQNSKLPRRYVRVEIDHADHIERLLVDSLECLNYGESKDMLGRLFSRTLDAHFLVKDALNEFNRVQGA